MTPPDYTRRRGFSGATVVVENAKTPGFPGVCRIILVRRPTRYPIELRGLSHLHYPPHSKSYGTERGTQARSASEGTPQAFPSLVLRACVSGTARESCPLAPSVTPAWGRAEGGGSLSTPSPQPG